MNDSGRRRFYFNRVDADGKNVGYPVAINLILEDKNWKVFIPSY